MKKIFAMFAIAVILVACGNKGDKKTDAAKDSVNVLVDSARKKINDAADPSNKMINKAVDSLKPKM